jgi:hypothetical protein
MAIKIVVYSDPYLTNVVDEVTGFSSAREAAHHRDNSDLWDKYTQLQQDTKSNSYHSDDMRSENLDDGSLNAPRQVVRYHEKRPHSLGAFLLAFVIVVVVVFLTCPAIMAVVGWLFRL